MRPEFRGLRVLGAVVLGDRCRRPITQCSSGGWLLRMLRSVSRPSRSEKHRPLQNSATSLRGPVAAVPRKVLRLRCYGATDGNMKLLILTSVRAGTASNCLPILNASRQCSVVRVIISRGQSTNRSHLWQQKGRKIKRIGILGALNGIRMRGWNRADAPDLASICERLSIPVFETECTNSDETVNLFKDADADLGLSLGNGYISQRIFSIPKYGMINVHGERLPEYQNAQSVIWPIYHLETTTGLTIHQIDRSIDTGKILYREEYPIVFCKNIRDTIRKTIRVTQERTPEALLYVCENYPSLLLGAKIQQGGRKFTTPTIRQFFRMVRNNTALWQRTEHSNNHVE